MVLIPIDAIYKFVSSSYNDLDSRTNETKSLNKYELFTQWVRRRGSLF